MELCKVSVSCLYFKWHKWILKLLNLCTISVNFVFLYIKVQKLTLWVIKCNDLRLFSKAVYLCKISNIECMDHHSDEVMFVRKWLSQTCALYSLRKYGILFYYSFSLYFPGNYCSLLCCHFYCLFVSIFLNHLLNYFACFLIFLLLL